MHLNLLRHVSVNYPQRRGYDMNCIILAAGEATRNPNKGVLPIADGRIAIESSLDFWARLGGDPAKVYIVVGPDAIVLRVLVMRGWKTIKYVTQPEPNGVVSALGHASVALGKHNYDPSLILFCDNVYESCHISDYNDHASVRRVDDPAQQLDAYDEAFMSWVKREIATDDDKRFLGWMILCRSHLRTCEQSDEHNLRHQSLISYMNAWGLPAIEYDDGLVTDIGTIESYKDYVDSIVRSK